MKQQSIKKNFILSTIYQLLCMITPLITTPYISRVLGAAGIGIYSYTYSIETYFSMFAALGTVSYGAREIARNRDNRGTVSRLFWEIEGLTVITTAVCIALWGVFILLNDEYRIYYIILTFYLIATMLDISWLYMGVEQFQYIVIQNSIFKIMGIVALFLLVKNENDVAVYVAIMGLSTMLGNASMWIYLRKFVDRVSISTLKLYPHFKETLIYFIPTIATSVYTILDKTLIGIITQDVSENGYYEQATKIINMCKAITFASLNSVLGARISYLYMEERYDEIKQKINKSMNYILLMGFGICMGLIGVAESFVPLFFGEGYDEVIILLKMLSPLVIVIGISNCLGSQYYTPAGLRKQSAMYIIVGSVVNLCLNIVFIPVFKSRGAVIATLAAEMVITALYFIHGSSVITLKDLIRSMWKKAAASLIMLAAVLVIGKCDMTGFIMLLVQVCVGVCIYICVLLILRDEFALDIIRRVKREV